MEEITRRDDVILLFDYFNTYCEDLYHSFQVTGQTCPTIVIEDNGFLPEGFMSVYEYFLGDFSKDSNNLGRPRFFNEIQVPEFWEISGNSRRGQVHDLYKERGRIFYAEPVEKRLVKVVDWLDEKGVVRSSDHYNRYGALYARTIFNAKGQKVNKSYFSPQGKEVIMENYVTGDIILNEGEKILFFHSKTDFVIYFLEAAGYIEHRLFFNSLSTPFFVSQRRSSNTKKDILFWQEPIQNEIPGNMQIILEGTGTHTAQIMVQKKDAYKRLLELGASSEIVKNLGFVYPFKKDNHQKQEVLICTNSDRIEHCEEFVKALPNLHFRIAAITEMSSKLMRIGNYENVTLYPGVKRDTLEKLFEECDFYLDINYESEIVSAIRRAFLHNHLIYAFQETLHNRDYVASKHIYKISEFEKMVEELKLVLSDKEALAKELEVQHEFAMAETKQKYLELINEGK